ncbi:hypothetical protein QQF64_010039 [Cirrhinus molitorella]|uniref:Uncharacterized protein n=2 Tax=Cirrhinus molitorella TaxID=172907 RepID=A0ABR3M2V5_9TELE|nr:hypothetical protein Q8A67_007784 [Cirrhinus molitorella]
MLKPKVAAQKLPWKSYFLRRWSVVLEPKYSVRTTSSLHLYKVFQTPVMRMTAWRHLKVRKAPCAVFVETLSPF